MTPAVVRERARCARIAADHEEVYRRIAEKAKTVGDREHKMVCLARAWAAEDIRRAIEQGSGTPARKDEMKGTP